MFHDFGVRYVVLCVWNSCVFSCPNQYHVIDVSEDCLINYYRNGTVCKECPAGYYGKNCSTLCIPPAYGCSCSQRCDCPVCHYVVGCIFTPKSTVTHLKYTSGENAEPHGIINSQSVPTNMIIILIGVVITLALLILILYAIRKHCSSDYVNGICNRKVDKD